MKIPARKQQNIFIKIIKFFAKLFFFPIFAFVNIFRHKETKKIIKKSLLLNILSFSVKLIAVFFLFLIWFFGYFAAGVMIVEKLGFYPHSVQITGTGSMFPTLPKSSEKDPLKQAKDIVGKYNFTSYPNGLVLFNKRYFGYKLQRLDIVVADNQKIRDITKKIFGNPSGVVKRIIGLPGETLELKDGIVYINGDPLKEAYTAKPHSTFGEEFLTECKKIKIPGNKYFLMGDNRKGSGDSREFGWVDEKDISLVLPFIKQIGILDKNYRDTSRDLTSFSKTKIDVQEYIKLLNEKRKENGAKLLKHQLLLDKSAEKRGEAMLKYDDLSFEATKSAYTMYSAMKEMDYWNPYYGEFPTLGYYDAKELLESQFEHANSKKFLLDDIYQEVGISEVKGEINGCPTQIIVQHYAGYVPPDYKKENIGSWTTTLDQLKKIQPSWNNLKNDQNFYNDHKQDIDDINLIINIRISNIEPIVDRMNKNEWLSEQQIDYTYKDENLFKDQENIAERLNSK